MRDGQGSEEEQSRDTQAEDGEAQACRAGAHVPDAGAKEKVERRPNICVVTENKSQERQILCK